MLPIFHFISAISAIIGFLVGLLLSKYYKSNKIIMFICWFLLFFGIGQFIHVMIFDSIFYNENKAYPLNGIIVNETSWEYHVIEGNPWEPVNWDWTTFGITSYNNTPYSNIGGIE